MALTLSGTNGVVGAGFTLDSSGASVTAGVGTFSSVKTTGTVSVKTPAGTEAIVRVNEATTDNGVALKQTDTQAILQTSASQPFNIRSQAGNGSSSYLAFWTRNDERLRIASDGKVGIGSTIPTTALDVNGVITGDGSGLTAVNTPSFSARRNTTQNLTNQVEAVIIFNSEDHDTDNAYDTSTGEFTVPAGKGGLYQINAHLGIDDINSGFLVRLRVFKNGSAFYGMRAQNIGAATNTITSAHISATATLAAGDVIKCMGFHNDTEGPQPIEVEANGFSMFRLSI